MKLPKDNSSSGGSLLSKKFNQSSQGDDDLCLSNSDGLSDEEGRRIGSKSGQSNSEIKMMSHKKTSSVNKKGEGFFREDSN